VVSSVLDQYELKLQDFTKEVLSALAGITNQKETLTPSMPFTDSDFDTTGLLESMRLDKALREAKSINDVISILFRYKPEASATDQREATDAWEDFTKSNAELHQIIYAIIHRPNPDPAPPVVVVNSGSFRSGVVTAYYEPLKMTPWSCRFHIHNWVERPDSDLSLEQYKVRDRQRFERCSRCGREHSLKRPEVSSSLCGCGANRDKDCAHRKAVTTEEQPKKRLWWGSRKVPISDPEQQPKAVRFIPDGDRPGSTKE
jgi:hypothetical protein